MAHHQKKNSSGRYTAPSTKVRPLTRDKVPGLMLGKTREELDAVELIAMRQDQTNPPCSGPLLIHADGAVECHGEKCEGAMESFHDEDALEPCPFKVPSVLHHCSRCEHVPLDRESIEAHPLNVDGS